MSRHLFFEMRLVLMRLEQMDFNAGYLTNIALDNNNVSIKIFNIDFLVLGNNCAEHTGNIFQIRDLNQTGQSLTHHFVHCHYFQHHQLYQMGHVLSLHQV